MKKGFPFLRELRLKTMGKFLSNNEYIWSVVNVLPRSPKISDLHILCNSICLRLMEIYDKSACMVTSAVFIARLHVATTRCSKTGTFVHSSNHISRSQWLPKYLRHEANIFFWKCATFCGDSEKVIRNRKNVFRCWDNSVLTGWGNLSEIMVKIHVIGSQDIAKQS